MLLCATGFLRTGLANEREAWDTAHGWAHAITRNRGMQGGGAGRQRHMRRLVKMYVAGSERAMRVVASGMSPD